MKRFHGNTERFRTVERKSPPAREQNDGGEPSCTRFRLGGDRPFRLIFFLIDVNRRE